MTEEKKESRLKRPPLKQNIKKRTTFTADLQDTSVLSSARENLNETTYDSSKKGTLDLNKKVKEMMWPWVKTPFAVNNFDNRFKAQEKLLHEQHGMIKEQQKLIEDLKFQQSQVAFKEQIALLEQIKTKQVAKYGFFLLSDYQCLSAIPYKCIFIDQISISI